MVMGVGLVAAAIARRGRAVVEVGDDFMTSTIAVPGKRVAETSQRLPGTMAKQSSCRILGGGALKSNERLNKTSLDLLDGSLASCCLQSMKEAAKNFAANRTAPARPRSVHLCKTVEAIGLPSPALQ